jgi:hypothetical protein
MRGRGRHRCDSDPATQFLAGGGILGESNGAFPWAEDDAIDAEMERVLAMTPEERENELRAAGVDVEADQAKGRDWRARAFPGEVTISPSRLRPIEGGASARKGPPKPSRGWWWSRGGMVAAAALAAGALLVVARREPVTTTHGNPYATQPPEPTPRDRAEALRQNAYAACDRRAWAECRRLLDEAKGLDPEGDADPRVKTRRDAIRDAKGN